MKIKFGELKEGTRFFDTYSGEYWIKVSENMAFWDDENADGDNDWFELDELVEIKD